MKGRWLAVLATIWMVAGTAGCSGRLSTAWRSLEERVHPPAQRLAELADQQAARGLVAEAQLLLEAAARLDPADKQIANRLLRLKNASATDVTRRMRQATKAYQQGDFAACRTHLLAVLRADPGHRQARDFLFNRLRRTEQKTYRIRRGDSLGKISARTYKDATLAPVVAWYNGLSPEDPIYPGKVLVLPHISQAYLNPPATEKRLLAKAGRYLAAGRFARALALVSRIPSTSPRARQARELADRARIGQARRLIQQGKLAEALQRLKQVSPGTAGKKQAMAEVQRRMRTMALEEKLARAEEKLRQAQFQQAAAVAEQVLEQAPGNEKARQLLNEARYALATGLLADGKDDQALEVLETIDPDFRDTAVLINDAQLRLNAEAEAHYRNGVRYFINEELELAIEQWRRALELDPQMDKARRDMANARRLLRRLQELETRPAP